MKQLTFQREYMHHRIYFEETFQKRIFSERINFDYVSIR